MQGYRIVSTPSYAYLGSKRQFVLDDPHHFFANASLPASHDQIADAGVPRGAFAPAVIGPSAVWL